MSDRRNPVVAVGASAGGLQALEQFFEGMPGHPGLSCVVLTHLAPDRDSHLADILARYTDLAVLTAEDGARLQPDHVYVLPAGHAMGVRGGRLSVRPHFGPERLHHPIDLFFGELAQDQGENAVGIVLSGTGTDGTLGLRAIKEAGGLTLAQGGDGTAPAYDAMPGSAILGGGVDLVLPAREMPMRIIEILKMPPAAAPASGEPLTRQQMTEIHALLRESSGHDFSGYKSNTFGRRVARRMQITQLASPADYIARLRADERERHSLFLGLLISVTGFFRDADAFEALAAVLPKLTADKAAEEEIRVWVPGCATGEEVYSIAMLLREHLDQGDRPGDQRRVVRIFATDINEAALNVARSGLYPAALVEPVSAARRQRFFEQTPSGFKVVKAVRDMCVYSSHSVIKDPPFSRMDLISCRNLLIYVDGTMQDRLIPVFHFALRPGGYLFLGTSENISRHQDLFRALDKQYRLFQRREHGARRLPLPPEVRGQHRTPWSGQADMRLERLGLRRLSELRMLERYTPAHVVVNREGQVLHYSSKTGKYLEAPSGAPSRELFSLVRTSLRLELKSAFEQARAGKLPVLRERVELERDDGLQPIDLIIEKLPDNDSDPLYLVIFRDRGPTVTRQEARERAADETEEQERLRHELAEARERLQVLMEEYDTSLEEIKSSNEELISLNEELQSANEEHETAKEELQSVNEELNTVNTELHENIQELDRANADLRNLFDSTHIAIIFLDKALRIRSFTPAIRDVFSLLPSDQGRPLLDIAAAVPLDTLRRDLADVLRTGEHREFRVASEDGSANYLVRVQPYRDSDGNLNGVTVAFVDVTTLAEFEAHQETLIEELNHRVRNMLTVVVVLAKQTIRGHPEPEAFRRAFIPRIEALAKTYQLVSRERWKTVPLGELIAESVTALCAVPDCIDLAGPDILATPKAALALGLVLAELATNAVKYGALSRPRGRIEVTWRLHRAQNRTSLVLRWREKGGPPVQPPQAENFGSMLIRREIKHDLGGRTTLRFAPDGLEALFKLPFETKLFLAGQKDRG
jgi:two-component system, chemotaxis family, CheB/CheR fusion protein